MLICPCVYRENLIELNERIAADYIDAARAHAHNAQQAVNAFSRELEDMGIETEIVLDISGLSKFADIFFDNFITDMMVQSKIRNSLNKTQNWLGQVRELMAGLDQRHQAASDEHARLHDKLRHLIESW